MWYRLAAAALAQELPYATPAALIGKRKKERKKDGQTLTAVAQVVAETQVSSLVQHSGLTELVQLWCRLQLQLRFSPWPEHLYMPWEWPQK